MPRSYSLRIRETDRGIFDDIQSGKKFIETRAATARYKDMQIGDTVTFVCGTDKFQKTITKIYHWPSVDTLLKEVPLKSVMPGVDSPEEMKKKYASYPEYEAKIREYGLIGFEMA